MEVFIILVVILGAISWIFALIKKASDYDKLKPKLDSLESYENELKQREKKADQRNLQLDKKHETILLLAKQKAIGFPWLANAYADFYNLEEMQVATNLENKSRPAYKAAEIVKQAAARRRAAEMKARLFEYQIKYYENLFPWLADLKSEDVDDELIRISTQRETGDGSSDPAQCWLTPEKYRSLPNSEKYQIALDRYWSKKKSKWEIGKDYERYIGYWYERKGFAVRYQGIIDGFEDLGRDLIAKKGNDTYIVQCKNWSQQKIIHEKHIFQLFGTSTAYRYDHPAESVMAHFITSTKLSDRARGFAELIGIKITDGFSLKRYPCIKCHVSKQTGEKIYHLPFDQQYDRTMIEMAKGEHYLETVKEAEQLGFRRAFRFRGQEPFGAGDVF